MNNSPSQTHWSHSLHCRSPWLEVPGGGIIPGQRKCTHITIHCQLKWEEMKTKTNKAPVSRSYPYITHMNASFTWKWTVTTVHHLQVHETVHNSASPASTWDCPQQCVTCKYMTLSTTVRHLQVHDTDHDSASPAWTWHLSLIHIWRCRRTG